MMTLLVYALAMVIMALIAGICCVLHELAHLLAARLTGARVIAWGWAKHRGLYVHVRVEPPCRWRAVVNLLSGPAVHLLLALLIISNAPLLHAIGVANLAMAAVNLLLPHSDGRRALAEVRS